MNLLKLTHNKALCGRRKRKIVLNRSVGAEDWSSIHLLVTETKGNNGLLHLLNMGKGSRLLIWLQPRLFLPLTLRMCVSCIFRFPPQITPKGQTRAGGGGGYWWGYIPIYSISWIVVRFITVQNLYLQIISPITIVISWGTQRLMSLHYITPNYDAIDAVPNVF